MNSYHHVVSYEEQGGRTAHFSVIAIHPDAAAGRFLAHLADMDAPLAGGQRFTVWACPPSVDSTKRGQYVRPSQGHEYEVRPPPPPVWTAVRVATDPRG